MKGPSYQFPSLLNLIVQQAGITQAQLSEKSGLSVKTLSRWSRGAALPGPENFNLVVRALSPYTASEMLSELTTAYVNDRDQREKQDKTLDEIPAEGLVIDQEAVEQVPAAFRFGIQGNKIDALPETPEAIDQALADDLYQEFARKLGALAERLHRSNADPYVKTAVDRLLQSLGHSFSDVRPGVVLMHARTIEAVVAGFDTEEGRQALFPDAIAMINDVNLSGQDFLSCFPNVRRIERERIAAGIDKDPAVIQRVREQTAAIAAAAEESEIVASGAVKALRENEPDIQHAKDVELAADLVADEVLITRNFVSETLRAAWEVVGPDFKDGAKAAARILPPLAVIALLTLIAGPVAGLAGILRGNIFKPVRGGISTVAGAARQKRIPGTSVRDAGGKRPKSTRSRPPRALKTPIDLFRSGTAVGPILHRVRFGLPTARRTASRMTGVEKYTDVETYIGHEGKTWVVANSGGVSCWANADTTWRGVTWRLPAGSPYSGVLRLKTDISGRWIFAPAIDMIAEDYVRALTDVERWFVRI